MFLWLIGFFYCVFSRLLWLKSAAFCFIVVVIGSREGFGFFRCFCVLCLLVICCLKRMVLVVLWGVLLLVVF